MILYFDKNLKLKTIIPHGEIPRQCGDLELIILLDSDFDTTNKLISARFKRPGEFKFSSDYLLDKEEELYHFNKITNSENVGDLQDNVDYIAYLLDISGSDWAVQRCGRLQVQFTLFEAEDSVISSIKQFGNSTIFLEETLGLTPDSGLGMTRSEYERILVQFNKIYARLNSNFETIGEFNSRLQMYQAAFNEIYTNNYSLVSARYYDNVFIFMRSDAENEEYLLMVDSSLYKYYKLKNDGTMIENDGANLSGFIYLTSASGTLSADQIENAEKNLCYILYNNRVYQKNSSTIDSMTFVNYDLLYSDDVFNAARYTITITISGNTYSYVSSSKLVETYTKEQINSLLNTKIYYNDIVDNVTSDEIRKPLSARQGKVLRGLITNVESDISGNYLKKKPDGTNDIISNNKVSTRYLPDFLLGQLLFGGTFNATSALATLTTNAKSKLGINYNSIVLTNDASDIYGYASNEGTFFVVEAGGTFAGIEFATGDWLISIGTAWKKVDNTDEVTSVNGQTGNVTTGTYDKPEGGIPASDLAQAVQDALANANSAVQNHQAIKVLKTDNETALTPGSSEDIKGDGTINLHKVSKTGTYDDLIGKPTLGTAASHDVAEEISLNNDDLVTSGQLYIALRDMPVPMVFKGTLGENATISSLPQASSENNGFTYKVVTAGTYGLIEASVGDLVVSNGEIWIVIPAGDESVTEDTWRGIKVNGTLLKDNGITTGDVDFVEGTNVTITTTQNGEIIISATDTTYDNLAPTKNGENVSLITTGDKYKILQSLYHLGAFDSADGKTRQTGYLDLGSLNWKYQSSVGCWYAENVIPNATECVASNYTCYNNKMYSALANGELTTNNSAWGTIPTIIIKDSQSNYPNGIFQYKLATSYTEQVIEGESILPLDNNMAQMIRQDVVEGLNLINATKSDTTNNYWVYNTDLKLSAGTYTIVVYANGSVTCDVLADDVSLGYVTTNDAKTFTLSNGCSKFGVYVSGATTNVRVMLVKGTHPYPHSNYHANKHISDEEATLLKQEEEKCRNLFNPNAIVRENGFYNNSGSFISNNDYDVRCFYLKAGKYTLSGNNLYMGICIMNSSYVWQSNITLQQTNVYTFTLESDNYVGISVQKSAVGVSCMLNKGSEAEPYQEWNGDIVHMKQLREVEDEIPTNLSQLSDDSTHRLVTDTEKFKWNSASDTYPIYDGSPIWVDGNRYGTTPNGIYICYPLMGFAVTIRAEGKLDSSWIYIWSKTDVATKPFILWIDTATNKVKITYLDGSTPEEYAVTFSSSTLSRVSFQTSGIALVKKLLNVNDNISYTKDN